MPPISGSTELQAEEQNPPVPDQSPREVATSLRDAIGERLKTYNEASASLYGTASVNSQDQSALVVERDRLLRDIDTLSSMLVPGKLSLASLFGLMLLFLAIFALVAYLTEPDKPHENTPFWQWWLVGIFVICSQTITLKMYHQIAVPRVKATLEKIRIKLMNKESVSTQEIAELKKWYWNFVQWEEQTPNV